MIQKLTSNPISLILIDNMRRCEYLNQQSTKCDEHMNVNFNINSPFPNISLVRHHCRNNRIDDRISGSTTVLGWVSHGKRFTRLGNQQQNISSIANVAIFPNTILDVDT